MGGRPTTTGTAAQRARQARYRARLDADMIPEADDLDRALLQSLHAYAAVVSRGRGKEDVVRMRGIMKDALGRLDADGYDRQQAKTRLVRRLGNPIQSRRYRAVDK